MRQNPSIAAELVASLDPPEECLAFFHCAYPEALEPESRKIYDKLVEIFPDLLDDYESEMPAV